MDTSWLVKEGDNIMLKKENGHLKCVKVWKKRKVFMDKKHFSLDAVIGEPYGSVWEIQNDAAVKIQPAAVTDTNTLIESDDKGGDNRNIIDDSSTQKLSREDISSLKESGHSGESIVAHLVENSATYKEKTVFSQAKYQKKKREKHMTRFKILRPCTRLLCEMYWNKPPSKGIQTLRVDTLAQILTTANVQPNTKVMLVETTQGLMLGAIMERLAGHGTIVQFHSEDQPVRLAVDGYNFPKSHHDIVHSVLLSQVGSILKESNSCNESISQDADKSDKRPDDEQAVKNDNMGSGDSKLMSEQTGHNINNEKDISMDVCEAKSAGTKSEGTKSEGTKSEGTKSEGTKSEGTKSEGTKSEGTKSEGTKSEGTKSEDTQETGAVVVETAEVKDGARGKWKGKGKRKIETPEDIAAKLERQQRRQEALDKVKTILNPRDMDALVIVSKFQPSPILMALIQFLSKSRPFVVYCANKEPLVECYMKLRERGGALDLRLTETWLRNYQVLPERTHPLVTMSGTGGYLLTGTNVEVPPATTT